ncbi:hypothetical protein MILUP08_46620 [Micromonospora lupini str. Lupac 08]|uniref:Uncharacterized protein n=1 Tax=Micromonospora lupini str. Lupac 08 TaxID=1150864 RepID=I0LD23_9ACTN|nr:hypothetical protein MILUP08_46620 [Micromonospora lupini str. Lupac 08]
MSYSLALSLGFSAEVLWAAPMSLS